ncbi:unnamed protein product, partial [Heterosigma akashiwo]
MENGFVLYIMSRAMRTIDNPAFLLALTLANHLMVPVVVTCTLRDRLEHATARKHTFILESLREVEEQLLALGVPFLLNIHQNGRRAQTHLQLAFRAIAVVMELPFVQPHTRLVKQVQTSIQNRKPLYLCDCDNIVPVQLIKSTGIHSSSSFDKATALLRTARVSLKLPVQPELLPAAKGKMTSVENSLRSLFLHHTSLKDADIASVIQNCDIDHQVFPVSGVTEGGGKAGYGRWNNFKQKGLLLHHKNRNNPLLLKSYGSSRLSAYLNLGVISPFRIARETKALKGPGPSKFLYEFQIWREFSFWFCHHHENYASVSVLPEWVRKTLHDHESDFRNLMSLETLQTARTGHLVWDLMQQTLLLRGELHNNMRMTWGKALIPWTVNAEQAYRFLIHLNDHFALDGESPPGYLGLLWCLGKYDKPFPESKCFGKVRSKTLTTYSKKLDTGKYA